MLGHPLILTAGARATQGAQLGLLGFDDDYHVTFEGSVAYLPFDWLVLAYEFRQKPDPYGQIPGLIGDEDHWQALRPVEPIRLAPRYGLRGRQRTTRRVRQSAGPGGDRRSVTAPRVHSRAGESQGVFLKH